MFNNSISQNDEKSSLHELARAKQTLVGHRIPNFGVTPQVAAESKTNHSSHATDIFSPFTPDSDAIAQAFGATASRVLGRIWRYTQMSEERCRARHQSMADDLGLRRDAVEIAIRKLIKYALLKADDDWIKGNPRSYVVLTDNVGTINEQLNELIKERDAERGDSERPRWNTKHELFDLWNEHHNSDF